MSPGAASSPRKKSNVKATSVIVLTCEHGGRQIPAIYRSLFSGADDVLRSHRGWDPGALAVAEAMAVRLGADLFSSTTSRLLVELNRSLGHRSLFSNYTDSLSEEERQEIIDKYWQPYRDEVTGHMEELVTAGRRVIHLSIHSFTPVWDGKQRRTRIGLLYDPRRLNERTFCNGWKADLRQRYPEYCIHSNQPYKGITDGFTTWLRRHLASIENCDDAYAGIEVEINQALIHPSTPSCIDAMAERLCHWPLQQLDQTGLRLRHDCAEA
jgi:predicted N-formylglutamate amidohydrolase